MNRIRLTKLAILVILMVAIYGTSGLVIDEYNNGNVCPLILTIPACYIVLFCFVGGLIGQIISKPFILRLLIGIVFIIASYGSLGEIVGYAHCPRTSGGTAMCFISWLICFALLILSYVNHRTNIMKESL